MLNRHYIKLTPVTIDKIRTWVQADPEALLENYYDSLEMGMPFYVVVERDRSGLLTWMCYTMVEFSVEFNVSTINKTSDREFVKL